jgi:hypothetical protein
MLGLKWLTPLLVVVFLFLKLLKVKRFTARKRYSSSVGEGASLPPRGDYDDPR